MTLRAYPEEVSLAINAALERNGGKIVVHNEMQAEAAQRELEQKAAAKEGEIPEVEFVVDARQQIGMLLIARPEPLIDPNYLPTNADFGFSSEWRNFRTADFFAEKLGMTIEEVQKLYREERDTFFQLIDAQGLRMKVKAEDL